MAKQGKYKKNIYIKNSMKKLNANKKKYIILIIRYNFMLDKTKIT